VGFVYLDSSVLIAWLLKEPNRFPEPDASSAAISSELIRLEFARVVRRHQIERRLKLENIVPVVLARAAVHFPTIVGTLDAIHLATALLWQEDTGDRLTFLTHDRQLRTAARACGFATSQG
jgi:predicted nucleic acid-binding protein